MGVARQLPWARVAQVYDGRELSEVEIRELFNELSRLGEVLESRFEMEDFLIENLHNAHAGKVASA